MKLKNKYVIWWYDETKEIQNDYTQEIDNNDLYDFSYSISFYASNTIEDIENFIVENGLIKKDVYENAGMMKLDKPIDLGEWEYSDRPIRLYMSDDSIMRLAKDYPELLSRIKVDGVPTTIIENAAVLYFKELEEVHKTIILSYGGYLEYLN